MKVTLIKPPEESKLNFGVFSLMVLAAAIRDICTVTILDTTRDSVDDAVNRTIDTDSDLVGVTTMSLKSIIPTLNFIRRLRPRLKKGILVIGGHGATLQPHSLLKAGADAVVCGEGENTLRELIIRGVKDNIEGLALLRDDAVLKTPTRNPIQPLDSLNEPAWDLIQNQFEDIVLLETSRGCPHQCAFCSVPEFNHYMWRAKSPRVVVKDIMKLIKQGATIIHIVDDNFTASPKRVLQICESLQNTQLPILFVFSARSDDLLKIPELIPSLAESHFLRVNIGIETLNPQLAESMKKPISNEIHKKTFETLRSAGIFTIGSFIVGFPGETQEMRNCNVDLAVKIGVDSAHFIPFQPLPNTPMASNSIEPETWSVEVARKATKQFRNHPKVIKRLLSDSKESTIHGLLARASLARWIKEGTLSASTTGQVRKLFDSMFHEHILSQIDEKSGN